MQDGERYTTASLSHIRYGLNRCLQKRNSTHNIVDRPEFKDSHKAFADACKQLKTLGKGHRKSYKPISNKGIYKNIVLFCFF